METYIGPYVLGGLEPEEAGDLRRHLEDCAECQATLDEIGWIPSWLQKIPADELERMIAEDEATPAPVDEALATIKHHLRRRRRVRWLTAAAAVLAIAAGVTTELLHNSGALSAESTVQSVDEHTRVAATLTMTPQGAKTALRLTLTSVEPGEHCSLVAHTKDGRTEVTATWVATYRGTADIPITTSIPAGRLSGFDVVTAGGRVLVRLAVPPHR
jgi:hypothetical protein